MTSRMYTSGGATSDFKSSYRGATTSGVGATSSSKKLASYSRSRSVDDVSRVGGGAETSKTFISSADRRSKTLSSGGVAGYKSYDTGVTSSSVTRKGGSLRQGDSSLTQRGGCTIRGRDTEVCTGGVSKGSDGRLIMEEGGVDRRSSRNQYRIVGRITRTPSPSADLRYKSSTSKGVGHTSYGVSSGGGSRNIDHSRDTTTNITKEYNFDSRRDHRVGGYSHETDRGRLTKDGIAILGGSSRGYRDGGADAHGISGSRGGGGGDFRPSRGGLDHGLGSSGVGGRGGMNLPATGLDTNPIRGHSFDVGGGYPDGGRDPLGRDGFPGGRDGFPGGRDGYPGGRGWRPIAGGGGSGGGGGLQLPFVRGGAGGDSTGRRPYGRDDPIGRHAPVGCRGPGGIGGGAGYQPGRHTSPERSFDAGPSRNRGTSIPRRQRPRGRSVSDRKGYRPSVRRSRSMNDLLKSPSPNKRGGGGGGTFDLMNDSFPVCKRFPNCSVCAIDIPAPNQNNKETLLMSIDDKGDDDLLIEKKDKEIQLQTESISQITQMLQKTKKELEVKSVEVKRKDVEITQLRTELKRIVEKKKVLEHSNSENQITLTKLDSVEMRLRQMSERNEVLIIENKELIERIKQTEISEHEFSILEQNVYELQIQLRDMEDVELHRDELLQKIHSIKKQRDEFLARGKMVEEERNEFSKSNKTLEQYLIEWKRKTQEFKQTNSSLKQRILLLEKEKKELEIKIDEIQSDRVRMQSTIFTLETEREDLMAELKEVVIERNTLEQRLAELEDMLGEHDQLEEGFHSLRLKVSELTKQRDDAEILIHSYKTKIQNLKKSIRTKEDTVLQLTHDIQVMKVAIDNCSPEDIPNLRSLKGMGGVPSVGGSGGAPIPGRGREPSKDPTVMFDPNIHDLEGCSSPDDYDLVTVRTKDHHHHHHHRLSPSDDSVQEERLVTTSAPRPRRRGPSGRSRNAKKYVALFDYDPYKSSTSDAPEKELRLREGDYITVFGEMDSDGFYEAEINGVRGMIPGIYVEELTDTNQTTDVHHQTGHHHHRLSRRDQRDHQQIVSRERTFIALYDYDPYTMGTTDRPDLQLSLKKGEVITVLGEVDIEGYFTAVINGRRGLVPSNFVEEYSHSSHAAHNHTREEHFQGTVQVDGISGPPYAPRDLKVKRVVTRNAVLLSWLLPSMDDHYISNGCKVIGYRLWVNGQRKQDVTNPSCNKALIDDVDLAGRVEFSIQTIGESDVCSEKCHFAITGALSTLETNETLEMEGDHDVFVALYDYDPVKSSPNPNPALELLFREGDMMIVYDKSRSDGFYSAKMNGKKGLVPSNFIERVNRRSTHKTSATSSRHSSSIRSSRHVTSHHDSDSNSRKVQFDSKSSIKKK